MSKKNKINRSSYSIEPLSFNEILKKKFPIDFVTNNLLTAYELDIWKKHIREEDMY